ncbi:MAG: site-2 protease family protein [Planctomycetota bacterium]
MLGKPINLPFKVFGVPVGFDWSFLIILPWFIYVMARNVLDVADMIGIDPVATGIGTGITPALIGTVAAGGLFLSVLIHEFGHVLTARAYGVRTRHVTLWLLGGVAALERMPRQRGAEAVIAIVGPLTSFAVAAVFAVLVWVTPVTALPAAYAVFTLLAFVNLVLAIFNCIPALPLDGGRVLRSLLALAVPHMKATRITAIVSKTLALGLVVLAIFGGQLWYLLIAGFIWLAVSAETRQSVAEQALRGLPIRAIMRPDVVAVPAEASLGALVSTMFQRRHSSFPVVDDAGELVGTIGLRDLGDEYDPNAPVRTVMRREVVTLPADQDCFRAFEVMGENGVGRLIVIDGGGRMVGIVGRSDLMRAMQIRALYPRPAQEPVVHRQPTL